MPGSDPGPSRSTLRAGEPMVTRGLVKRFEDLWPSTAIDFEIARASPTDSSSNGAGKTST